MTTQQWPDAAPPLAAQAPTQGADSVHSVSLSGQGQLSATPLIDCFDLMADAHMEKFGMKGSLQRRCIWESLSELLDAVPRLIDEANAKLRAEPIAGHSSAASQNETESGATK